MSSEYILELNNVWKKYKLSEKRHNTLRDDIAGLFNDKKNQELKDTEFWALKDINIKIKSGETIGLYGPNGSGKTTIIKLLANVTYPTRGEVFVRGVVAPLISVSAGFHPELTGRENIYTNGTILGMKIDELKEKEEQILEFSGLEREFMEMPVKKFSSGMTTRLGFSIAVHSDAEIFLLDEVLEVGDESFREKSAIKIKELMMSKKTFIIVSHNKSKMKQLVSRIIYLDHGKIENEELV